MLRPVTYSFTCVLQDADVGCIARCWGSYRCRAAALDVCQPKAQQVTSNENRPADLNVSIALGRKLVERCCCDLHQVLQQLWLAAYKLLERFGLAGGNGALANVQHGSLQAAYMLLKEGRVRGHLLLLLGELSAIRGIMKV